MAEKLKDEILNVLYFKELSGVLEATPIDIVSKRIKVVLRITDKF